MDVTIVESEMEFTFPNDRLYHIERSPKFSSITGRKTCECIVMHNDKIVFIEAKKSSPRKEDPVRFDEFIRDISMKFVDSFDFYCSVLVDRHKDETMPKALRSEPLSETEFEFYLIINGHRPEWLPPVMGGRPTPSPLSPPYPRDTRSALPRHVAKIRKILFISR